MRLKVLFSDEDFDRGDVGDFKMHKYVGLSDDGNLVYKPFNGSIEEWEDASKEPKEWWYIDIHGPHKVTNNDEYYQQVKTASKQIGNYFETREEAEKAVEKLSALTKLCKKGFEFNSVEMFGSGFIKIKASIPISEKTTLQERSDITDSLYLLFGGEE